nr:immunoglobulin heavy chain junction region [Macaca mulatta]MOV87198.1 immunoglobulin heavy chain junction region [Macaca mulatta]MOV88745.1 immunoglobulin heavy chain junction region [Macaca mulatta]MOV89702.1 immunoglobulin heavy chain junction region [Macaca mulatta]MOV89765.1 immunoglobulin heavy chain junction region [Macaca mulatta]
CTTSLIMGAISPLNYFDYW